MGELPRGTVTFLFTDIEESTRLLRQLRERYVEVRDAHNRLLRQAFAAAGGHEIGTEGDAFFVAFRRAKDAVTAALAAQRALAAHPWPEDGEIRVRMGIHTGEPDVHDEGYLGLTLHRVARISAAGHGGQVLLSTTTREIVEDDLPGDVSLLDLGEQWLKDFDRPQRIFQLAIEGLRSEFPPLKTVGAASPAARFAGRGGKRDAAARAITEHPWYLRRRRLVLSALAGVIAAAVSIPVFALGGSGNSPTPVLMEGSGIAVIDARTNDVVDSVSVGPQPRDIVAAAGDIWVASLEQSSVLHIDPATAKVVRAVPLAASPIGLATEDGDIWALAAPSTGSKATVQRIASRFDIAGKPIRLPGSPYRDSADGAVAAGEGVVWVVQGGVSPVIQLDPRTSRVVRTIDPASCCPNGVAVGAGGVAWVSLAFARQVARIDPRTGLVKMIDVGEAPAGIAVGEGAVWVAVSGENAVKRIDPATRSVETTIPVGRSPTAVAVGASAVWVANSRDGTVSRIDPRANRVDRTVEVGGSPLRLVYSDGKVWVSVQEAAAETVTTGETVEFSSEHSIDSLDPAMAYTPIARSFFEQSATLSWQIEFATCAKLVNYPDRPIPVGAQLVPEVAQSLPRPTDRGRTYTFTIRNGFRFSPPSGQRVTARTLKYSIERSLSPSIGGPALRRMIAPLHGRGGVLDDVFGAKAFEAGKAKHITGIVAKGRKLTIKLVEPAPDLLARLALPFFCAVPLNTPVAQGVRTVAAAGPYYVSSYIPGQKVVLKRNPNYHGPRPHALAQIEITIGDSRAQALSQIESGRIDYSLDGVPPNAAQRLNDRYGPGSPAARARKQQYFVNPTLQNFYLALNTSRSPFSSFRLRRAVNYVVDRRVLASLLAPYVSAKPTDQYLPAPMPGFRDAAVYPLSADAAKARRLAGGRRVKAVLYSCNGCGDADQLLQAYLATIGIEVIPKRFPIGTLIAKLGRRGEPFDLAFIAWGGDYLDPASFLNVLLSGRQIRPTRNFNISYFDDPLFNRKLDAAAKLSGRKRYTAYGKLDIDLGRNAAPMVALVNLTRQDFFSARMGCQIYNPVYGMDIAALCVRK